MVDIHCHILPQMDDGAKNLESSISMAKQAISDGINTIVATPHSQDGLFFPTCKDVVKELNLLNEKINDNNLSIKLISGMEVHLCHNLYSKIQSNTVLTINNSKYLLLELPGQYIPPFFDEEIFQLKINGITPILAHPERNLTILKDWTVLYDIVEKGVLIQITSASITGKFGHEIFKCAKNIIKHRLAHIIASDAHSPDSRPPVLSESLRITEKLLGSSKEAREMVDERPNKIINNIKIEIPEPFKRKKFYFSNLF